MSAVPNAVADIRPIPLELLQYSESPAQVARRKHYDMAKLEELAETLKSEGQLQPIVVRPILWNNAERFEVVAGERRARASAIAGLPDVIATVRELDDHQAAKIRLIENLQREEEHPLAEAEGYEELVNQYGYTVEQIGQETGKSKAYVYARLKLLALCPEARKAFYDGKLDASKALLIARIPLDFLQAEAIKEVARVFGDGETMSYRDAADYVRRTFMLRLTDAPFPTDDDELLANTPACGRCPKNTVCQPELFADVSTKDALCTDRVCFAQKKAAQEQRLIEKAEAAGQRVYQGKEAKKIAPQGKYNLQEGFVRLEQTCFDVPGGKSYKQLLGRGVKGDLLVDPKGDGVVEIIEKSKALKMLHESGVLKKEPRSTTPTAKASSKAANTKAERDRQIEDEVELRVLNAVRTKDGGKLTPEILRYLCAQVIGEGVYQDDLVEKTLGFTPKAFYTENLKPLEKLSDAKVARALIDAIYAMVLEFERTSPNNLVRRTAKRLKIDEKKIRQEVIASLDPPPASAKAVKKAARK